jgi:hypothetical protein
MNPSDKTSMIWFICVIVGIILFSIGFGFSYSIFSFIGFCVFGLGFGFLLGFAYKSKTTDAEVTTTNSPATSE